MVFPAFCRDIRGNSGPVWFVRPITTSLIIVLLLFLSVDCALASQSNSSIPVAQPESATRIDLSNVGYKEMASMERLSEDESNVSLDYVDAAHVLLTILVEHEELGRERRTVRLADFLAFVEQIGVGKAFRVGTLLHAWQQVFGDRVAVDCHQACLLSLATEFLGKGDDPVFIIAGDRTAIASEDDHHDLAILEVG